MTTLIAWLSDITPKNFKGGTMGLFRTFMDVGGFIGPILFMFLLIDISPQIAFYFGMALNIFNVFLIMTVRPKHTQRI
jgi:MFS family permease